MSSTYVWHVSSWCLGQYWPWWLLQMFGFLSTNAPSANTTAYADNWSWWSACGQPFSRSPILLLIFWGCKLIGRKLGFGAPKLRVNMQSPTSLHRKHQRTATDLGGPLTHHGITRLGTLRDRLQEAELRIQKSSWPSEVKIHIIAATIYPLALYDCEFTVVEASHLKALRAQVVNALLGEKSQSASSAL